MDVIFKAVKYALNQKQIDFDIEDEKQFVILLRENGLSGLVFSYIKDGFGSEKLKRYKTQILYDYALRDEKQLLIKKHLRTLLNEHQFKHIFLKGSRLKPLYEKTYMRGMGDIDILIEAHEMKRIEQVLIHNGFEAGTKSPAHDTYHYMGIPIEIHPTLYNDFNLKYVLFKEAFEYATLKQAYEYTLEPNFELLYLMYHLAKHFESSGIGLRSLLDIGIYVKTYQERLDPSILAKHLESMSMKPFFNVILYLNNRYFGFETTLYDQNFHLKEDAYQHLTNYIITSGIHGTGHTFNPMAPRLFNTKNKGKSKFKVLWQIAFPKYQTMKIMYPKLKTSLFLPVFYGIRLFDLSFRKRKASKLKLKQLEVSHQKKSEITDIFETLGL
ncbi:MAG: nucleotidyltransferase family protein [Acholeplasma sp.]|nr:nucleotidyltransferase family protein [Acholeplasma sp.]